VANRYPVLRSGLPVSCPVSPNREQRPVALVGRSRTAASQRNGSGGDWMGQHATNGGLIPAHLPMGRGDLERDERFSCCFQARFLFQRVGKAVGDHRHLSGLPADPGGSARMHAIHSEARRAHGSTAAILRLDTSGAAPVAFARRSSSVHTGHQLHEAGAGAARVDPDSWADPQTPAAHPPCSNSSTSSLCWTEFRASRSGAVMTTRSKTARLTCSRNRSRPGRCRLAPLEPSSRKIRSSGHGHPCV
jgi:hypothetical protein